jgi:hypothetical protein
MIAILAERAHQTRRGKWPACVLCFVFWHKMFVRGGEGDVTLHCARCGGRWRPWG